MIENCYTIPEAAKFLGVTEGYIRRMVCEGKILSRKIGARLNIIPHEEIQKIKDNPRKIGRPKKIVGCC